MGGQSWQATTLVANSQDEVAAWVAKQRKTSPNILGKGKTLHKYCTQHQHRLGVVARIYGEGSEVPSDVEHLRTHATSSERVFVEEPAFIYLTCKRKMDLSVMPSARASRYHVHGPRTIVTMSTLISCRSNMGCKPFVVQSVWRLYCGKLSMQQRVNMLQFGLLSVGAIYPITRG